MVNFDLVSIRLWRLTGGNFELYVHIYHEYFGYSMMELRLNQREIISFTSVGA